MRYRPKRGFSIIELAIAIGVLTFGVYAIYSQFIATRDLGRRQAKMAQGRAHSRRLLPDLSGRIMAAFASRSGPSP